MQAFDSSYFFSKSHFWRWWSTELFSISDILQTNTNGNKDAAWKSKVLSDEGIKLSSMSDNSLNPETNYIDNAKIKKKINWSCLTLKRLERLNLYQSDFSKNVSSKEKVKPCFLVTFDIIIKQIFPENVIEIPHVVQNIWRLFLSILAIFINFL